MKSIKCLNSLATSHEFVSYNFKFVTSFNLYTVIAIVSVLSPGSIKSLRESSMYGQQPAAKRPRPSSSRSPATFHHRHGKPNPGQSSGEARTKAVVDINTTPKARQGQYEETRENSYRDSLCIMCSDPLVSKHHHHFSSASIRRLLSDQTKGKGKFLCPICKELEDVTVPASETRRVVMADSTLYNIWEQKLPKETPHFEIDSIVGGRVRDITRALIKNYLHLPNRYKIVVVAGVNNIGGGETAEEITKEIEVLKSVVADHSKKWKHSPPSFAVFCTVVVAPKFCSLKVPDNPPEPEIAQWVPPSTFQNRYPELKKLNSMIIDTNSRDNLTTVRLDYIGVKRFKSGTVQHIFDNKVGASQIWRETDVLKKLHFAMDVKLKVINKISSCFKANSARICQ